MEEWPSSSEMHRDKNFSRMTLNSQNQTHIAQQFRREKLRIPDLQAPVSPQRDDASNHTSGSKSMGLPHRPPEPKRAKTGTGLNFPSGFENCSDGIIVQNAMGDVCQVYSTDAISLDPLNFPAGAELFPVSATKWMPTLPLAASAYNSNTNSLYSSDISSNLKRSSNPSYWGLGLHGQIPQQSNDAFFVGMGSSNLQNVLNNDRQTSYPAAVEAILVGTNLQSTGMVHKNKGMLMEPYITNLNNQPGTLQLCDVNLGFHVYPEALQGNVVLLGRESGGATNNRQAVSSHESYVPGIQLPYQSSMAPIPIVEQGLATSLLPSHLEAQTSNNWPNGANELLFLPMPGNADSNNRTEMTLTNQTYNFGHQSPWTFPEYGMKHPMMIPGQDHTFIQGAMAQNLHLERSEDANLGHLQGLSLSLSSQHPSAMQGNSYHVDLPDTEFGNKCLLPHTREEGIVKIAEEISNRLQVGLNPLLASRDSLLASDLQNEDRKATANIKPFSYDHDLSTLSNFRMLSSSKYSRVVQHLLDEVCSVGKDGNSSGSTDNKLHDGMVFKSSPYGTIQSDKPEYDQAKKDVANFDTNCSVSSISQSAETVSALTQEERQHLQIKKTQLLAMLQEVDRQYRQYYDHMQAVVFSFDSAVGQVGAARPYTRSALKAMSRHFRCLRDTISNQIQMSCKALGEDGFSDPGPLRKVSSRLRFVDQQLRQQRALQQLGMLQQPAWRPQRGLPEHSVSILRAWLFEHFLHPYPKDADKMMLARQTGLSRSQVSNWFINARVRLWKPMVEEMYLEENKEHEHEACAKRVYNQTGDGISCEQNISENRDQNNAIVELNETMHNHEDLEFDAKVLAQGPRHQSSLDMRKTESDIFLRRITPTEMAHADEQDVNSGSKSGALEGEMNDEIITNNLLRQSIHQNYNPGSLDSSVFEKNMQIRPKVVNSDTFYRDDYKIVNLKGYSTNPCTVQNENMFMHHAATCDSYAINDGNLNLYTHMDVPPKLFGRGGVSLTLGLQQHADNLSQATSHDYINSTNNPTESHNVDGFHLEVINHTAGIHPDHLEGHETLNFQSKKRVPNQLLHEFVA